MKQYDVIVIGAGPGGSGAAIMAASKGLNVALVEADAIGGTCLNRGCVPTKCMCAAAERIIEVGSAFDFGVAVEGMKADYGVARRRAAEIVDGLRADLTASLGSVEIIEGRAVLGEGRTVVAGGKFLRARRIIIATGSAPAPFPAAGADLVVNSDQFLKLDSLPASLAVVGGGVIGLEFASIANAYGCDVTVIEFCKEILPGFDTEVARRLRSYLSRRGIGFVLGARVTEVSALPDGSRHVAYTARGKECSLTARAVLSAVGRRAVLPDGLADAGVKTDERGFIIVDDRFATTAEGIYAVGDVNGKKMLAHAAEAQARVVTEMSKATGSVPGVVFTVPECASVGLSVDDTEGLAAEKVPFGANTKAIAAGHADGLVKLVYRLDDRRIVGCQIVGAHAADLIGEAAVLIDAGYTVDRFAEYTVSAHPGLSELLQLAAARVAANKE